MHLNIKPYQGNTFPLSAILVRGAGLKDWITALQQLQLTPEQVTLFPIPGKQVNSLWACLLVLEQIPAAITIEQHQYYQTVYGKLFIPENTSVHPFLSREEIEKRFSDYPLFFHPEVGFVPLETSINIQDHLLIDLPENSQVQQSVAGINSIQQFNRFEIHSSPVEDTLDKLEQAFFPEQKNIEDVYKPLSVLEKIKLFTLRKLLANIGKTSGEPRYGAVTRFLQKITGGNKNPGEKNWFNKLERQYATLEQRNRNELQKLMDLFAKNPEQALQFAVPLDQQGTSRGIEQYGGFEMWKRWINFSLGGQNAGRYQNARASVLDSDSFMTLSTQYHKTAEEMIAQKNYEKAAFIYLKLLKQPDQAGDALEKGNLYAEAASVYLKHSKNTAKAADCYDKGNMFSSALALYKELGDNERTGDMYSKMSKITEANTFYQLVADEHSRHNRYVKAAQVYRNKMNDTNSAQEQLLKGWRNDTDAFNCLNNYFVNIDHIPALTKAITDIYKNDINNHNAETFLKVIKHEYDKDETLKKTTSDMAYELVSQYGKKDPSLVAELKNFNKDPHLNKDILRHKFTHRK